MLKLKALWLPLFFFLSIQITTAKNLDKFFQRFEFIREKGKLIEVRDKTLESVLDVDRYLNYLKEALVNEQNLMQEKEGYFEEIENLLLEGISEKNIPEERETVDITIKALKNLREIDVDSVFASQKFRDFMKTFEFKVAEALNNLNPHVIAKLNNPKYFYKKNVTYTVVNWGLKAAKKIFASIPVLNTASFALVRVEKLIREKRFYHQNILLHYLERFSNEDLKLSPHEVDLILSSIYESRIQWYEVWESNSAVNDWKNFGLQRFFRSFRSASQSLRNYVELYDSKGERINYGFQEVTLKGETMIINLLNKESMFEKTPAIAYIFERPKHVFRKRIVLEMAQLGLSFLTISDTIKRVAEGYMKSFYEAQKLNEGALLAHFESEGQEKLISTLKAQYMNPFEIFL